MSRLLERLEGKTPLRDSLFEFTGDGMLDLFIGFLLIDVSVAVVGGSVTSSGVGFVVIYLLLLLARQRVTAPRLAAAARTGAAPPVPRPPRWTALSAIGAVLAGGTALAIWFFTGAREGWFWVGVAFLGLTAVALAGTRLGAPRFLGYACAAALVLAVGVGLGATAMAAGLIGVGVVATAVGAAMLGRFLRSHPREIPADG